jgi:hypothetical protein
LSGRPHDKDEAGPDAELENPPGFMATHDEWSVVTEQSTNSIQLHSWLCFVAPRRWAPGPGWLPFWQRWVRFVASHARSASAGRQNGSVGGFAQKVPAAQEVGRRHKKSDGRAANHIHARVL